MDLLILKTVNTQLTKQNDLLKSQVLDMTERFNIIVDWINNHFHELLGVPEEVVSAIHGNLDSDRSLSYVSPSDDEESLPRRGKTNSVTQQSIRNKSLSYNPFIALEKLSLDNVESLAASNQITNHETIIGYLAKLNFTGNSSLTCTMCNRTFNSNIQLKKHKSKQHETTPNLRKVLCTSEVINSNNRNQNENMIVKLEMPSESSDSDSNSLYDPLDDTVENDFNDDLHLCSINIDSIRNDSSLKDKIEIKVEPSEVSQDIIKYENIIPVAKPHIQEKGKRMYHSYLKNNFKARRMYRKIGKEDSLQCQICEKVFPRVIRLREHERRCHHVPINATIVTESEIEGVKKTQTTYKCLKCKVHIMTSKKEYFSHKKNCHPRRKTFRTPKKTTDTPKKPTDNPKRPTICDICGKRFLNHRNLSAHMRFVHQGEKEFLCTECGKCFSCNDTLSSHERVHTGEKIFKCDFCEGSFISRQAKYRHEKALHLGGLNNVKCHICGNGFEAKNKLIRHIQDVHESRRSHQCPQCEKCFKRKDHLDYHLKTHNNPNSRKRGLNKDIDHMKAAQKRRHCNKKNGIDDVQKSNEIYAEGCLRDNAN